MTITLIDIIILLIFLFFTINGYNSGFIKQTSTIIGIVFALIIAMGYYSDFIPLIENYLELSPELIQFISFAILFILINLFVHILGLVFKRILDALYLRPLDHAVGAFLGLVKGFIIVYFFVLMLSHIPYTSLTEHIYKSFLAVKILEMTPLLQDSLQNIFSP